MRKWALLVVALYAVIVAAIAFGLLFVGLGARSPAAGAYVILAVWTAVMVCCQVCLLVVPVRVQSRRPVTKRHLVWPVLVAVLSCAAMAVGMFWAVAETIQHSNFGKDTDVALWWAGCIVGVVWIVWAFLFGFYTGGREPTTFMRRVTRFLVAGSILELLVAVPTHIIARARDYCCAGFLTVWGLGLGLSVMLFAFGPGVFALFVRRWQAVKGTGDKGAAATGNAKE